MFHLCGIFQRLASSLTVCVVFIKAFVLMGLALELIYHEVNLITFMQTLKIAY